MISVLLVVCVSVAAVSLRAVGSLRRRAALRLQALVSAPARLAAALLDLGNHLMLSAEERRAMRLRRWLSSTRARRLGVAAAAVRAEAKRLDDVTLEIPIGTRTLEGNPGRYARPLLRRLRAFRERRRNGPAGRGGYAFLARVEQGLAGIPWVLRYG
ncbi:MAG TPA: hypothetical protein VFI90_06445 [Rubrobacter sp.]|nr:hypothetical protein [Rubrobacter sp.]